ncbi:LVIS_2131 family protein [Lentilactobacillus sp. SPB1-3]|uniref:LVIS_2131 family protein n=1 Tax=Lentilactobacillus terminaliae TaxID=3003483 RepID=A0ACD5DF96_9LACO|nr:LVIS_2131 family protein [Lentilactobacillus sp. SPB1-3]MCZ0976575.1 LVIS_2131 family protein [Lentilactobacillus sp. SPB1-3]
MKSAWNLVGMALWLILIIYLIWMIHDMRSRRLRLLVTEKKSFTWNNFTKSAIELVIFVLAFWGMTYATFFQDVNKLDKSAVTTSYTYKPLVLRYAQRSHYVTVSNTDGRKPVQVYTFYLQGGKYEVTSNDATISYGANPLNVSASAYKWNKEWLKHLDVRNQKAWVGIITTTYKKNFINGIGLHAGRQANRYSLIRIPDKSFMKTTD